MKRPSYHLLSIKTEYTPRGVLMVWVGFWCGFWCTPCAKEVALLRYSAFVLVALWDTMIILFQYQDGGKCPPGIFSSLSYSVMFIEILVDLGYVFE